MPALITKFVKVAQSGPTVDGRNIDPQWLRDMAETYDPAVYRAKIWPDHLRFGNNYGSVVALKVEEADGVVSLYASLAVNAHPTPRVPGVRFFRSLKTCRRCLNHSRTIRPRVYPCKYHHRTSRKQIRDQHGRYGQSD